MQMEVRSAGCPLGAKCEEVKEENGRQVLYRCDWFISVKGDDPQTGQPIDERRCALVWQVLVGLQAMKDFRDGSNALQQAQDGLRNELERRNGAASHFFNEFTQWLENRNPAIANGAKPGAIADDREDHTG